MNNLLFTAVIKCLQDLFHDISRLPLTKSGHYFHSIIHTASPKVFHDNVYIFFVLIVFENFNYARMVQWLQYIKFVIYSFYKFIRGFTDNFHRSYLVSRHMHYHENFPTTTLAYFFNYFIILCIVFSWINYEDVPKIYYIIFCLFSNFMCFLGKNRFTTTEILRGIDILVSWKNTSVSVLFIILLSIHKVFIFLIYEELTRNLLPNNSITRLISIRMGLFRNNIGKSIVLSLLFFSININHAFFAAILWLFISNLNRLRRIYSFILWSVGLVNKSYSIMWMILTSYNSFSYRSCFHCLFCIDVRIYILLIIIFRHVIFLFFFYVRIILLLIKVCQWLRFDLIFLLLRTITFFGII